MVRSIRRTATKLYSGSKKLRSTCSGNIRPVRRTLHLVGREQSSPVDEEDIKKRKRIKKWTTVSLGTSLASEGFFFNLLTCGRRSLVSGTYNYIAELPCEG